MTAYEPLVSASIERMHDAWDAPELYGMCQHPEPHTFEEAHICDALAREEAEDVTGAREVLP